MFSRIPTDNLATVGGSYNDLSQGNRHREKVPSLLVAGQFRDMRSNHAFGSETFMVVPGGRVSNYIIMLVPIS